MARANGVREIWAKGGAVVNSWLGVPSSFSAEVMAHAGWDSLVIDMQHGMIDYSMMVTMLQGISTTSTVPLVRVPWNDPAHIQKALHDALSKNQIAGAALAVFDQEPTPVDNPLLKLKNFIAAPHVAGVTREAVDRMAIVTAQNLLSVLDGKPNRENVVNKEVLG